MLAGTVALLRERSAAGVSIDAVLARSGAPRGSVYHHFPGGRDEMIVEAVRFAGAHIAGLIEHTDAADPCAVVRQLADFSKSLLVGSDFAAGCPVVALAVGGRDDNPATAQVVQEVFDLWLAALTTQFVAGGIPPERARSLATVSVAAAEGAIVLCRARRSVQPIDDMCTELCALLSAATGSVSGPSEPASRG